MLHVVIIAKESGREKWRHVCMQYFVASLSLSFISFGFPFKHDMVR